MRKSTVTKCEPAATIITALGGVSAVAEAAAVSDVTVQRWRFPKANGGTAGHIPRKYHDCLINLAKEKGVELSPASFWDAAALPIISATSTDKAA